MNEWTVGITVSVAWGIYLGNQHLQQHGLVSAIPCVVYMCGGAGQMFLPSLFSHHRMREPETVV